MFFKQNCEKFFFFLLRTQSQSTYLLQQTHFHEDFTIEIKEIEESKKLLTIDNNSNNNNKNSNNNASNNSSSSDNELDEEISNAISILKMLCTAGQLPKFMLKRKN